jgi:extradiol dioxygenase family protein
VQLRQRRLADLHGGVDAVAAEALLEHRFDPVPHFGVVMAMDDWRALAARLESAGVTFVIPPHIRFAGEVGEQGTMFFYDPAGNALEFKGFDDLSRLFAK